MKPAPSDPSLSDLLGRHRVVFSGDRDLHLVRRPFVAADLKLQTKRNQLRLRRAAPTCFLASARKIEQGALVGFGALSRGSEAAFSAHAFEW